MLALLFVGCAHEKPRLVSTPEVDQTGCFQMNLGAYVPDVHGGGHQVFIDPPALLELKRAFSTQPLARDRARTVRPLGPRFPGPSPAYGEWWPTEKGGLRIVWGNGFTGVEILLDRSASDYRGTARTFRDVGLTSQNAEAHMRRVACNVADPTVVAHERRRPISKGSHL